MKTMEGHGPAWGLSAKLWRWVPLLLLATSLLGWSFMVRLAVDDPGFAVETDYYKKASHWDEHKQEQARSLATRWTSQVVLEPSGFTTALVTVRLVDAHGQPLQGAKLTAYAFANARASDVRRLTFAEAAPGQYSAALQAARAGVWELRLHAAKSSQQFTAVQRAELHAHARGQGQP